MIITVRSMDLAIGSGDIAGLPGHSAREHGFDDPEAAWEMIRAGFGIGYCPAWMGLEEWAQGTVVETLREWRSKEAPLYAVRLDKRLTPNRVHVAQEFIIELTRAWQDAYSRSSVVSSDAREGESPD